jgi:hypothetical protein
MTLRDWLRNRWLVEHKSTPREIKELFALTERDLQAAATPRLIADWQMNISYNAALQLAILALSAEGFRVASQRSHELAIRSLKFTVGLDHERVDALDGVRRKRNRISYERAGTASHAEAREVYDLAQELRSEVLSWMKREHPELLGPSAPS